MNKFLKEFLKSVKSCKILKSLSKAQNSGFSFLLRFFSFAIDLLALSCLINNVEVSKPQKKQPCNFSGLLFAKKNIWKW